MDSHSHLYFKREKIVSNQIFFQLRENRTDKFVRVATKQLQVEWLKMKNVPTRIKVNSNPQTQT